MTTPTSVPGPLGFATRAVHVGQEPDPRTGDVVPPIHVTSTHAQDAVDRLRGGYEYGRGPNPTRDAFTRALASLEGGAAAFAFPSGLNAEDTLVRALTRPGDHISFGSDVYGGTYRLFKTVWEKEGLTATPLDLADPEAVARDVAEHGSRLVWVETPSNPRLEVFDLRALAEAAHAGGALLVADNTFASPYLQRPLEFGADVVVHSTTKYIGGHSDLVGGAVVVRDGLRVPEGLAAGPWKDSGLVADELSFLQSAVGAVESPRDAYLAHRGLKTLAVRMERHSATALALARHLVDHPEVRAVHYPGLESDPGHDLAARQMRAFGGVVSFELASAGLARRVAESTRVFSLAVSLGATESLIEYPPVMTHAETVGGRWAVPEGLLRVSVGLEDPGDLIADLDRALAFSASYR
ncbi:MAG: cystathionine gamma-synthase [Actinomyces sp.]|jgi:cystathionine gamma-synthase|nr:cystathionine gamma-synthase [Actinomyces sp.]MCI1642705.1 cystathionine gamma-synthase [Actinomyces sp.]MCI1663183.1 cystathionine gamma-synthase [Actinomyces sp.]MCI1788961.1 cystathionine gamma-synthase [Actinomyces sp.]MCI1829770.1 cystathionine gamma-synthase [Actinomyces sp.]